jgi:hypothetical protein
MRVRRIAGVVSAVALAGGLLTAALPVTAAHPAAAVAQSETVTITDSRILATIRGNLDVISKGLIVM